MTDPVQGSAARPGHTYDLGYKDATTGEPISDQDAGARPLATAACRLRVRIEDESGMPIFLGGFGDGDHLSIVGDTVELRASRAITLAELWPHHDFCGPHRDEADDA